LIHFYKSFRHVNRMGEIGHLEDEALKRKQRLAALKRKLEGGQNSESSKKTPDDDLPVPIFRSYKPLTEELNENVLPSAEPGSVVEAVRDSIEKANAAVLEDLDFMNLAPRKPDWDLKRDIAKKLEKLEKRTSRAIGEIIRERLKGQDFADAVTAGASHAASAADDE